jgi:hypothetical protein
MEIKPVMLMGQRKEEHVSSVVKADAYSLGKQRLTKRPDHIQDNIDLIHKLYHGDKKGRNRGEQGDSTPALLEGDPSAAIEDEAFLDDLIQILKKL